MSREVSGGKFVLFVRFWAIMGVFMQLIIKGLRGFEIYPENKEYIQEKFSKYEKMVKEPAILEIALDHTHGTRANIDKKIILNFAMPGLKKPEHIEELCEHFPEAVDKLQKRFEKALRRHKEKTINSHRSRK